MRYATFGFSDKANRDEGTVRPVAFALRELPPRRRGKDRRAHEEGGELKRSLHFQARSTIVMSYFRDQAERGSGIVVDDRLSLESAGPCARILQEEFQ